MTNMRATHRLSLGLVSLLYLAMLSTASGHSTGENYVWLNVEESHLVGHFEIRLPDLRSMLQLEVPSDVVGARGAIAEQEALVQDYIRKHFSILANGQNLPIEFTSTDVFEAKTVGHFAQYHYRTAETEIPDQITIRNDLLFEYDKFHRSLIAIQYNKKTGEEYGEEFATMVFSPINSEQVLDFTDVRGLLSTRDFIWQGMVHIWIGYDHILFLIALLLTAVLVRQDTHWEPVPNFRRAIWNIVKIITIFTVAHSITLTLAALDVITLPTRFVESIIALSIILVAVNNVIPTFRDKTWLLIFGFGLFHGLGFASVMAHLPFRMLDLVRVMLAFNIGVEIGQLAIVIVVFPVLYSLRKSVAYPSVVLKFGSIVIGLVASYWLIERAYGF